jgi:hypothetical protein
MFKVMKKIAILILVLLSIFTVDAQCPMCKAALTSNRDHKHKNDKSFGDGINKGILFLLSAPYILLGTAGFVYYKTQKKRQVVNGK